MLTFLTQLQSIVKGGGLSCSCKAVNSFEEKSQQQLSAARDRHHRGVAIAIQTTVYNCQNCIRLCAACFGLEVVCAATVRDRQSRSSLNIDGLSSSHEVSNHCILSFLSNVCALLTVNSFLQRLLIANDLERPWVAGVYSTEGSGYCHKSPFEHGRRRLLQSELQKQRVLSYSFPLLAIFFYIWISGWVGPSISNCSGFLKLF